MKPRPDCGRPGCGHRAEVHEHDHHGTYCGICGPDVCPSYKRPRRRWFPATAALVLAVSATTIGWGAARAMAAGEHPPECVKASLTMGGHDYWGVYCGQGSAADSPLVDHARGWSMTLDGANRIGQGFVILGSPR